ncbi:hypothetical protein [Paenibacillus sp. N3.4]|uniref:hypothetical protein n=1 Tax=Paenibacillus sp. N3.4 TaxID=2603222 RepID=UPI001C9C7B88|nr:hypothetical protein [Paenibacillus sp. N3.4]
MRKTAVTLVSLLAATSLVACSTTNTAKDTSASSSPTTATATTAVKKDDTKPVKLRIYAQYADDDTKTPYDYAVAELKKETA